MGRWIVTPVLGGGCGCGVGVHHGGKGAIGHDHYTGVQRVADPHPAAARLERVLRCDPAMGVIRHADAGYQEALDAAREKAVTIPMMHL